MFLFLFADAISRREQLTGGWSDPISMTLEYACHADTLVRSQSVVRPALMNSHSNYLLLMALLNKNCQIIIGGILMMTFLAAGLIHPYLMNSVISLYYFLQLNMFVTRLTVRIILQ